MKKTSDLKKENAKLKRQLRAEKLQTRGYREVSGIGSANKDWSIQILSEDSDVWQNAYILTARMRDLFKTDPIYIKYRELIWCNVLGEHGYLLRSQIKETEDRVIHTPDEKGYLDKWQERVNRVREWAGNRTGNAPEKYRAYRLADEMERRDSETVIRGSAMVMAGDPDVFANKLVQDAWTAWQRAENCDTRGRRSYNVIRQLRLISSIRDGDFFLRMICDPEQKPFGFKIQMINAEWCDRFYNDILVNGNVVRMGIEYKMNEWGIGKIVAFYFIKRQPNDWQWGYPGAFNFANRDLHERISADEIIHYARAVDADGTRPAPWCASTIPKSRQLDQYTIAEVIAAREHACKTGFYYSDIAPEGGLDVPPDPKGLPRESLAPGETRGLPYGIKYQSRDVTHPNGNFENFRKGMIRSFCSGMPGADYSRLANDYEAINFSAGRLQMLDTNEIYKLIQRFDIQTAETPIFEGFLEMALIMGAIKLPLAKLAKFKAHNFQARRWRGVDEVKEETASAMRIANKKSSRQREAGEEGVDFEEVVFELAEEEMLLEGLGMTTTTTADAPQQQKPGDDGKEDDDKPEEDDDEHDTTLK